MLSSDLKSLRLLGKGKARDMYEVDEETLYFVTTDRLSIYDVDTGRAVPEKGRVLTALSAAWFAKTEDIIADHLLTANADANALLAERLSPEELEATRHRSMLARRLRPIRLEAVVRGYLIGNLWKEYVAAANNDNLDNAVDGVKEWVEVWGHRLPKGLGYGQRLDEPLFTPSTKADKGQPDVYLTYGEAEAHMEPQDRHLLPQLRQAALAIYGRMSAHCLEKGIIMADTKMEFGVDPTSGSLMLMDELGTPDSSRFWRAARYEAWFAAHPQPGTFPESFDRQHIKAHFDAAGWKRGDPVPTLPPEAIQRTTSNYLQAEALLLAEDNVVLMA
ncbi:SAICAR synt superfamily domain protein [Mollivirus kamchatka]|nr:SAICAR synt superfamily domain protein [Mollivirus kamchatka]